MSADVDLAAVAGELVAIAEELKAVGSWVADQEGKVRGLAKQLRGDGWAFPVGTEEYPPEAWYCAQFQHAEHTGIDLNLDRYPWGDVERGMPIYAVAPGKVVSKGSRSGWEGVVVIQHEHDGAALYARYAHLDPDKFEVGRGDEVVAGQVVGYIGSYSGEGDHLHFDMATDAFVWDWWLTPKVNWVDPVPILCKHLGAEAVERMLGRGDG